MKFYKSRFAKVGIAIAWATAIGCAQAYSEGSYYDDGTTAASQNSTVVTERRVATVASESQANMVLSQISSRLDGHSAVSTDNSVSLLPQSGGNAGSMYHRGSIWMRAGYDNMKEDNTTRFGGWNANLWSLALGYDYKFNDKVLAGLALTYSNLNGSTKFNNGSIRDNAYGLVPYVAFLVTPSFDIDLMGGYSRVNKSRDRSVPNLPTGPDDLSGPKATSKPKSDRYFGALFGNYKHHVNRWNLLVRLGYLYVTDRQKSFTETGGNRSSVTGGRITDRQVAGFSTNVNRISHRLQAGYQAPNMVEPYIFLTYAHDFGATKMKVTDTFTDTLGNVDSGYVSPNTRRSNHTYGGGLGLNANIDTCWKTTMEANYLQSKKFRNVGGMLRIARTF